MRIRLGVGIILIAAGLTLSAWASHAARDVPPAPGEFRSGAHFFSAKTLRAEEPPDSATPPPAAGPAGPAGAPEAETAAAPAAETPAAPAAPQTPPSPYLDFEAAFPSLSADDLAAVRQALDPLTVCDFVPIRLMTNIPWMPPDAIAVPRSIGVVIIADAEADRWLVPLAGPGGGKAALYLGTEAPLSQLLADERFPKDAALLPAARLLATARCFADMLLVRRSAAARLNLAPKEDAPNALVVGFDRPGMLEDGLRLAYPLWQSRNLSARPVDWQLGAASAARWLGLASLAMILAGGTLLLATGLLAAGGMKEPANAVQARVVAGLGILVANRRAYAGVVVAMTAALVVGAVWGGPAALRELALANLGSSEPLAAMGLESIGLGAGELLDMLVLFLITNVVIWGLVAITVPGMVPGLGLVTALVHNLAWGVLLGPTTLTLLDRLPLRAAVAVVEGHAYVLLVLGAWRILAGVVRPKSVGAERRRQGYALGSEELYRLMLPAAMLLIVAGLVETGLLAAMSHWR